MPTPTTPPYAPHISGQVPAIMGVVGTLGTADTSGTAPILPIGVDPTTGAAYVYNLGPAGNISVSGTDPTVYLPARLTNGTTFYEAGSGSGGGTTVTVDHGSISVTSIPNIPGGTVGLLTRVGNVGTLELGTVTGNVGVSSGTLTVVPNTPGGTLGLVTTVTTVSNLTAGSIRVTHGTVVNGTLPLVTTVSNLTSGSVRMTVGTLTTGTLGLLQAGTITRLEQGSVNVTAGTITSGSIVVTLGTIATGTVVNNGGTQGKIDPRPNRNILSFSTTVSGTMGTLVDAPSAGSSIWLTSLDISQVSGTAESVVSFNLAATGSGVVARGNFVAGGGIAKNYYPATNANNTGTALTWNILSGSGTVSYTGHYFIDVP